ncbi:YIP1 family protein [Oceanicella actignis]|uniref:Yip1 domain-containing protein n=1 Tax=Oceanicella actignis TaxID=1189325 RepID=A0A1M7TGV9_9RHOB|nr:YIP1 family protein [Oceanicella actignis]SET59656.1 hypothetical protein SAMN04488119_10665 [Oceanicella actignis]SHN69940.1 hypothetical protein SAMN05216200_106138 [Oceanicella actignis]
MINDFLLNLRDAYLRPRESARRIIAAAPDMSACVLMVTLGYLIQSVLSGLTFALAGLPPAPAGLAARALELLAQLFMFALLAQGAYALGARFGGRGARMQVAAAVAWHSLATSALAPATALGMAAARPEAGLPEGLALLLPFSVGVSIWMFAQFVAEAHGFTRLAPVIGATLVGFIALGFVALVAAGLIGGLLG